MDYFYCPPQNIRDNTFFIDAEEFSHLVHVMRKKEGDEIMIVDGCGHAFEARIDEVKKKAARGTIARSYANHNEPQVDVTIAVGVLKNPSKFDFLVEKVTELGVRQIVPLLTDRTIPTHAKVDRWQKLALAAMKQSGRSYLPRVQELTSLDDLIRRDDPFDFKIIAHERAESSALFPGTLAKKAQSILLLIGPEGGFSGEEVEKCLASGFLLVYLGDRRLRTETAAIVATTLTLLCNS
ncbi:MAG: 16S rRNA (uracil(1498)-N(3))-methyltransferase [Ignavibacteriae bacterium]|nr:16S rRNA (uracil(1498)-N(3))-methyltransferase [Ignavibacteria bacterium]MBI3364375.1 16S rRNA (uracil(1498)-N(3))-methyltransferase [Ignavibacteriota bacterium]